MALASAITIGSLPGCGGAPATSPAPASPAVVAPKADAKGAHVTGPIDTSAVAAPPSLRMVMTVKNAQALQKSARDLAGPVFPILKSFTVDAAAQVFLGAALADVVDLGKPIDLGMLEANDALALSLALSSIEDARQNLAEDFDLVDREGGVVALVPHKDTDATKLRCEIRPAAGDAPYRLLCATHASALKTLGPYLARTTTRDPAPDDVRIRVFPGAMTGKLDLDDAKSPAEAALRRMAIDAIDDIGTFSLDGTLGAGAVDLSARCAFKSTVSPFTRIELSSVHDPKPLPDLFWRLPSDSLGALYARGAELADLAPIRSLFLDAMDSSFREDSAPDSMIQKTNDVLGSIFFTGGPLAAAYGFDIPATMAALGNATPKHPVARGVLHGWFMVGVDEPASRWVDAIHQMMALDKMTWKKSAEAIEKEKKETTNSHMAEPPVLDKKLPAGTGHFAFLTYPKVDGKTARTPKSTLHIYIVPDGNRTWLAMGENEPLVIARAKAMLAGTPTTGLASRTDLEALHAPTGFGGFVTPALFDLAGGPEDGTDPVKTRALLDVLKAAPDTEGAPIVFFVPGTSAGEKEVDLHVRASNEVVRGLLSRAK